MKWGELMARSFGTILLESQINQPSEINNDIQSYRIDPDIYKTTGELVKIGEGTIVPTIDQLTAGKIMREEITTYEDFVACGTYSEVAKKYKVSPATAHGWMMSLKAKHMGIEPEQKPKSNAQIMREEITTLEQFEAIGNYREVAAKYGVGKTAANDLRVKLRREKEKMEHQSVKAIKTEEDKPEIPRQSVEDGVESVQNESEGDCSKEGEQRLESAMPETQNVTDSEFPCFGTYEDKTYTGCGKCRDKEVCKVVTNNPMEETKDDLQGLVESPKIEFACFGSYGPSYHGCQTDVCKMSNDCKRDTEIKDNLQGLVEPDPTWNYVPGAGFNLSDKALERIAEELKNPITDEEIWEGIKGDINELKERANKRIKERLMSMF